MVGNVISNKGRGIINCNGRGIIIPNVLSSAVYGAEWAGTSSPAWTRTDASASFSDPNPYYSGMSGTPSSPFDNIMPWAGMRRVTDPVAGELVEIPKFYYKWTRTGAKMKLQISMYPFEGFYTSPAHADRGDGVGERDYVYVGRYHCASDYKSKTGVKPTGNITRANARSRIHNIGSSTWQFDFAMWWTINMLYLVEFANWDSQLKIGYGGGNGTVQNNGLSDNMPYHTGTIQSNRVTYGSGIQYRFIENLWSNAVFWCDGIYFNKAKIYIIKNPSNFSNYSGGTYIGDRILESTYAYGIISAWSNPSLSGYEYTLFPLNFIPGGDDETYITDLYGSNSIGDVMYVGADTGQGRQKGLFCILTDTNDTSLYSIISCRLQVLPSTRIS